MGVGRLALPLMRAVGRRRASSSSGRADSGHPPATGGSRPQGEEGGGDERGDREVPQQLVLRRKVEKKTRRLRVPEEPAKRVNPGQRQGR